MTFDIATANGTATTADNEYVASSLTGQSIPAGSSGPYNFTVVVTGYNRLEENETFFVNVMNVVGANVIDGQGHGTIINDDHKLSEPDLSKVLALRDTFGWGTGLAPTSSGVSVSGRVLTAAGLTVSGLTPDTNYFDSEPPIPASGSPRTLTSINSSEVNANIVGIPPSGVQDCVVRDDFNRFNSTNMGPNWTENSGDFSISGNRAIGVNGSVMTYNGNTAGDRACVDLYSGSNAVKIGGILLKYTSSSDNLSVRLQDSEGDGAYDRIYFQRGLHFFFVVNSDYERAADGVPRRHDVERRYRLGF